VIGGGEEWEATRDSIDEPCREKHASTGTIALIRMHYWKAFFAEDGATETPLIERRYVDKKR
jgi:hypothetical protein